MGKNTLINWLTNQSPLLASTVMAISVYFFFRRLVEVNPQEIHLIIGLAIVIWAYIETRGNL